MNASSYILTQSYRKVVTTCQDPINQSPKGIKWSAVPSPCSTFLGSLGRKHGSGPNRGQSPVEWGDFPSVHPFISPAINQRGLTACQRGLKNSWRGLRAIQRIEGKLDQSEGSEGQSEGSGGQLEGFEG